MRYMLCLALLCACSSTPKRHVYYCDGLEVSCPPEAFTHPGYTPAGAGLPEYRPTEEEPEVPRSPHKRVLPQTPETRKQAGFWAAKPPDAGPYVIVKEVPIPLPDDASTAELERAKACAQGTERTLNRADAGMGDVFRRKRTPEPDERNCAAFLAWHKCMTSRMWPSSARAGNERLAAHGWNFFKQPPNACDKWVTAHAVDLATFEGLLLYWYRGNFGERQ